MFINDTGNNPENADPQSTKYTGNRIFCFDLVWLRSPQGVQLKCDLKIMLKLQSSYDNPNPDPLDLEMTRAQTEPVKTRCSAGL